MTEYPKFEVSDEKMSSYQWTAIGVCVVLNMLDGFDILVMAFTANSVKAEWGLSAGQLGVLLSAGLLGMAIGALFIAPWGDRIGRRKLVISCVGIATIGMIGAALAQDEVQLGLMRALTGLGVGGLLSCTNVLASEYSSPRWRGLAVSLQTTGFTVGATVGGLAAVFLIDSWGWRSVFFVGAGLSLSSLILVMWRLPESVDFLLDSGAADALERINQIAHRAGMAPLSSLPIRAPKLATAQARFPALLSPALRRETLTLWLLFLIMLFTYYFVTSWSPQLLITAGMSPSRGLTGGVLLNIGGVIGTLLFGFLSARAPVGRVLAAAMFVTVALLAAFPATLSSLGIALLSGLLMGMCISGCIAGLLATAALAYPTHIRATGVGSAIGIGRAGAIASPLIVGALIDAGWTPAHLYVAAAALVLVAAGAALTLRSSGPAPGSEPPTVTATAAAPITP
ncbi:MFS transporter [Nocardia sp. NPDC055002]